MPRLRRGLFAPILAAAVLLAGASVSLAGEGDPDSCLGCHARGSPRADAAPPDKRIEDAVWLGTPHRGSCLQCHPDMEAVPHGKKKADRVDCGQCHDEEAAKYGKSAHGTYLAAHPDAVDVPTCASCHGTHNIHSPKDPQSPVYKKNLPDTCGRCHGKASLRKEHGIGATVEDYKKSVHGVALLEKGNMKAAGCSDCHSSHELRHRRDPLSQTFKMNIPGVCGTCHKSEGELYRAGIHGTSLALGNMDAPACTDCHTEHSIRPPTDATSTVYSLEVAKTTCPSCHNAERLVRKYGLPPDRVTTYQDSYHGLADRQGYRKAANCGSCHGVHRVLPPSDPASSIHAANLVRTCAQCHPDAGPGFVDGQVHTTPDRDRAKVAYWARVAYWILIPLVIGGMLLHNTVLLWKFIRDKYRDQKRRKHYVRFARAEVAVHMMLTVSFVTLAVTGFALTYPEAAWVRVLRALGMSEGVRAGVHRVAAVLMAVTAISHVAYSAFAKHGRYSFGQMLPRPSDLVDLVRNLRYHLGLSPAPPRFDRYDYTMKAEYWALVWGTLLMILTGLMLWFKVGATEFVPRWMVYVAERVHFYEAILACLAIVVWHFFFVMYHPDEYPMNLTFITGRITEDEMKHTHPVEYERLQGTEYEVPSGGEARPPGAPPPIPAAGPGRDRPVRGQFLRAAVPAAALLGALALLAAPSSAQENRECLECHGEKELVVEREGGEVSLFVDGKALAGSVHKDVSCATCHADLEGTRKYPHAAPPLRKVECGTCHEEEQALHAESLHGQALAKGDPLAPRCQDCHGKHDILPVRNKGSAVFPTRVPFVCGKCHQEGAPVARERVIHQDHILENYSESMHGEGLLKKGLAVAATCASCHTPHHILKHTDPRSSIARANIAATCAERCHTGIEQVHRKIIKGELWEKEANVLPACVDCHQPHKARKVFYDQGMSDLDCLRCHADPGIRRARDGASLRVDPTELADSRHAKVSCSQCHAGINASLTRACETVAKKVDCSSCHQEVSKQYQESIHGRLAAAKNPSAPVCSECHGTHHVQGKKVPASPTFPTNVPLLCARCHREGERAAIRYTGTQRNIIESYSESIHGKGLLKSGLTVTAMCTDCHTSHGELPKSDPASSVNPANLPTTCGRCHYGIEDKFEASVHSSRVTKTDRELPVCNTCHTAHTIQRADSEGFKLEIMDRCGKCHAEIAETYFDTYHGKVSRLGYTKTAKCYDCHGAHDILPVADPRSRLSRDNVVATCAKCHEGATRRFAGYLTHATHHDPKKYPLLFWTFWGMTSLLVGTFLVGGLHTLAWLWRTALHGRLRKGGLKWEGPAGPEEEAQEPMKEELKEKWYVRFSRTNRILHIVMIVSFMSLALTGLTLKFSYTGWAVLVSHALGGFESAGNIHRFAAVLMVGIFTFHIADLVRRKRSEFGSWRALLLGPDSMIPNRRDFSEFIGSLKWFAGRGPRPRYGRWTYWEKFDYFAVFWGVAIIGSTGFTLWFPEFFTRFIPGWFLNVATIIHSDEALLAVGFIFTVHFFNTHLRPEKFPMDIVVFTGHMPVEELRRDKPAEYDALVRSGRLGDRLAEPYPPVVTRAIRIFGWVALSLGFSIVLWIVYAMLFAYR